jgi:hypothetical protein
MLKTAAARQAEDSIVSSQMAFAAPTSTGSLQQDGEQNLAWNLVGGLASVTSHPWSRSGMYPLDSTSTLSATGGLFLPYTPRDLQQNACPPSLPTLAAPDMFRLPRLPNTPCLQDQQGHQQNEPQEPHGLLTSLNSTYWRDALIQDGDTLHSASTLQAPLVTFPATRVPPVPHTLTVPSIDQEGSNAQITWVRLPCTLSNPFDVRVLSNHQCYLRQQIEVFVATMAHVTAHVRGRNKRIALDQVGIQCGHCAHVPMQKRQIGSAYFPATLMGFYQAAQNMLSTHIQCGKCESLPESVAQEFHRLLEHKKATSTGGQKYWAERIQELGLVDTDQGVFAAGNVPLHAKILPCDSSSSRMKKSDVAGTKSKHSLHLQAPPPNSA